MESRRITYAASVNSNGLGLFRASLNLHGLDAVNLSGITPVKFKAWIPPPSNQEATEGSIFVCQGIGLIYRFCQSSLLWRLQNEKRVAIT